MKFIKCIDISPEEILGTNFALWWAPDGDKLLYAKFKDSSVDEYEYPLYGSYLYPSHTQYTTIDTIPYPKVCST